MSSPNRWRRSRRLGGSGVLRPPKSAAEAVVERDSDSSDQSLRRLRAPSRGTEIAATAGRFQVLADRGSVVGGSTSHSTRKGYRPACTTPGTTIPGKVYATHRRGECPLPARLRTLVREPPVSGAGRTETAAIHMALLFSLLAVSRIDRRRPVPIQIGEAAGQTRPLAAPNRIERPAEPDVLPVQRSRPAAARPRVARGVGAGWGWVLGTSGIFSTLDGTRSFSRPST